MMALEVIIKLDIIGSETFAIGMKILFVEMEILRFWLV
jgi:hypothetical protein